MLQLGSGTPRPKQNFHLVGWFPQCCQRLAEEKYLIDVILDRGTCFRHGGPDRSTAVMMLSTYVYGRTYWTKLLYVVWASRHKILANDHCEFAMIMTFHHDHVPKPS